jgi:hypothetical protein
VGVNVGEGVRVAVGVGVSVDDGVTVLEGSKVEVGGRGVSLAARVGVGDGAQAASKTVMIRNMKKGFPDMELIVNRKRGKCKDENDRDAGLWSVFFG